MRRRNIWLMAMLIPALFLLLAGTGEAAFGGNWTDIKPLPGEVISGVYSIRANFSINSTMNITRFNITMADHTTPLCVNTTEVPNGSVNVMRGCDSNTSLVTDNSSFLAYLDAYNETFEAVLSTSATVIIDNTDPTATLVTPADGARAYANRDTFEATVDLSTTSCTLQLSPQSQSSWGNAYTMTFVRGASTSTCTYAIDSGFIKGTYDWRVQVTDGYDTVNSVIRAIDIKSSGGGIAIPSGEIELDVPSSEVSKFRGTYGIGVLLAGIAAYLLFFRKK
jgi:hypothetical protein